MTQQTAAATPALRIDEATRTITIRRENGTESSISIEKLADLVDWLNERESDLRRTVFDHIPTAIRKPMHLEQGFYVGCTTDRYSVRVRPEDWERVLQRERERARELYFLLKEAEKNKNPLLNALEASMGMERPPDPEIYDDEIMASEYVGQQLAKVRTPEWWQNRDENLERGMIAKLP